MKTQEKTIRRTRRQARVRAKVSGTAARPRLSIFRSNTRIVAQIINDEAHATLAAVSTDTMKAKTPRERAIEAGAALATRAKELGVDAVVFDRGGYLYEGNIKALADAAREAGLTF